ncbi:MAG: archease [Methanosarcinaceae archaeon]|jgi:SHS2 domain-containing protein|nr:archease [Methanosarcinaceae archaeon]
MPMPTKGYEYLEHTADAKFRAYGTTLEEAFQNAAVAMFDVMIDTGTISDEVSEKIELTSADLDGLVVDWLSELLYLFEVERVVFGKFKIGGITEMNGNYSLSAIAYGESLDLSRHKFDTEVKAVTYNSLKVEETMDGWVVQVVVDT